MTRPRPIVGCDLDDVLSDFIKAFMTIAATKYGVDPTVRPSSWEWDDANMTKEMVKGVWDEITTTYNFWTKLDVESGVSYEWVRTLDENAKLYFPTARAHCFGDDVGVQSAHWLWDKFDISFPTVIVSNDKGPLAAALKYDYFIDDRPKNCIEVKQALPSCKVFLKDASHNKAASLAHLDIPRVKDFDTFAQIVLRGE